MTYKNFYKNKKKKIVPIAAIASIFLIFFITLLCDICGLEKNDEKLVFIPEGAGIKEVSKILDEEKTIRYRGAFFLYSKMKKPFIRQGGHILNKSMSYGKILNKLASAPEQEIGEIKKVLIPEGYELKDIASALEKAGLFSAEDFLKEANEGDFDFEFISSVKRKENRLEGYLFPATYEFTVGETPHSAITKMLKAFEEKILPIYKNSSTDYSLDEIITLASIIEREAAGDFERGKISSVFYNRMKKDMTLSSCATVQYIIKERKKVLSLSDTKINSPYNTYINKGLPPGPISSPGEASVKAALYPEETDYLYFAANPNGGGSLFSKTGEEHMKNANNLKN